MLIWKQAWFCTDELMKQIGKSYQRKMEEGSYDSDTKFVGLGNIASLRRW